MNILCIDTSSDKIALALQINNALPQYFVGENDKKKHNSNLLVAIESFLHKNNTKIEDIDIFGVVVGPGSFTGIRIGVATINAFALALDKKIVQITSLEQLADNNIVLLSCRHGNFYCGNFTQKDNKYSVINIKEIPNSGIDICYLEDVYPQKMLSKCIEKIENNQFVSQAKPFYIRESSAERECK